MARTDTELGRIQNRAANLAQDGYSAQLLPDCVIVTSPEGKKYRVDNDGHCSCPSFAKSRTCKHLGAGALLQNQEVYRSAWWQELEAEKQATLRMIERATVQEVKRAA